MPSWRGRHVSNRDCAQACFEGAEGWGRGQGWVWGGGGVESCSLPVRCQHAINDAHNLLMHQYSAEQDVGVHVARRAVTYKSQRYNASKSDS